MAPTNRVIDASLGKMLHHVRSALDLGVQSLQRVGRVNLRRCARGKVMYASAFVLGVVHQRAELGELATQLIGLSDAGPQFGTAVPLIPDNH
jgi:hypothetical protein